MLSCENIMVKTKMTMTGARSVNQKTKRIIYILLVIGMLISLFLIYEKFVPDAAKYCSFGTSFDCGIVSKSPYANLDGLSYLLTIDLGLNLAIIDISGINGFFDLITSNAFLGFITLGFMLLISNAYFNKKPFLWIKKKDTLKWLKSITLFSVLFGIYLFLIQHFILKTYCILCITVDIILISLLIIIWRMK